jgi:hypothetical protein
MTASKCRSKLLGFSGNPWLRVSCGIIGETRCQRKCELTSKTVCAHATVFYVFERSLHKTASERPVAGQYPRRCKRYAQVSKSEWWVASN